MSSSSQPWTGASCVTHGTPRWRGTSSITPRVMMPSRQCSIEPKRAPSNVISLRGSRPFHIASTHIDALCHTWDDEARSEEHTSELQSHLNIVCRLLLE